MTQLNPALEHKVLRGKLDISVMSSDRQICDTDCLGRPSCSLRLPSLPHLTRDSFGSETVVGWYRFSSRAVLSPTAPSANDYEKDHLLRRLSPYFADSADGLETPFVFLSLASSFNADCGHGIKGFDRVLFRLKRTNENCGIAERIDLVIPNLGHTDSAKRHANQSRYAAVLPRKANGHRMNR